MDITILRFGFAFLVFGGAIQLVLVFLDSKRDTPILNQLHSAFIASSSFGQLLYGLLGTLLLILAPAATSQSTFTALTIFAQLGWLSLDALFVGRLIPNPSAAVFSLFVGASALVSLVNGK
jgi:hypothetical protein